VIFVMDLFYSVLVGIYMCMYGWMDVLFFGVIFCLLVWYFCLFYFLASYICLAKDSLVRNKSMLAVAIPARYLLLMMGFFACYCGWIYNDFASVPFNFFTSCYKLVPGATKGEVLAEIQWWDESTGESCIYPFGIDPTWAISTNELAFLNSFKMKCAVILGVSQMALGVTMKLFNGIHFGHYHDIFFEFCPQIIFLLGMFGYMDCMVFIKWGTYWGHLRNKAPSIITILINIALSLAATPNKKDSYKLYGEQNGEAFGPQQIIGIIIFFTCLACVPIMLVVKPFILRSHAAQAKKKFA